ncbi:MAG: hemerythrin domain-containing protein [Polyangiaceae bacterium]|jgi:hemerythrin superfamily protein
MKATLLLRREHRNIEQSLALLGAVWDVSGDDFDALAADLTAHLAAEENVFYPAADKALAAGLASHRAQHARVRAAMVEISGPAHDSATFHRRLSALSSAFAAHARMEEGAVHPSLESALNDASLEDLGTKVATFRDAVVAACRSAARAAE